MSRRTDLLTLIFVFVSLNCLSQKQKYDTTIFIGGFQTSKFYTNKLNALGVYSPNYKIKPLKIIASQGTLENIDSIQNGFLSLTNLKAGNVTISVFKPVDTGLVLLNKRQFKVIEKPLTQEEKNTKELTLKPRLTIAGFSDSISVAALKNATKIDINAPFKIKSLIFTIYSKRNVYDGTTMFALHSGKFSESLRHIMTLIKSRNELGIILDQISVVDFRGKIYNLKSVHFKVIE